MSRLLDWRGAEIEVVSSTGGVLATADVWENLIRTGISPWPPPELLQKLYESRQSRAFSGEDGVLATRRCGFYSDLQSLNSEDAITWSVFGPIVYAPSRKRADFVRELLESIDVDPRNEHAANVWLWRRVPHPDTLVPGGPEIDFGIQTDTVFLLGEAKWLSLCYSLRQIACSTSPSRLDRSRRYSGGRDIPQHHRHGRISGRMTDQSLCDIRRCTPRSCAATPSNSPGIPCALDS
jgi:hypothetical protein